MKILPIILPILAISLLSVKARAQVPGVPNIVDITTPVMSDPKGQAAAKAADTALMKQLGISQTIDTYTGLISSKAQKWSNDFIDAHTPFKHDQVYFVVGTAYTMGVSHTVTATFQDPIFKQWSHTVNYSPTSAQFTTNISF